jgi:alpha-amylase/alpha-mannosidase (GH57 family)
MLKIINNKIIKKLNNIIIQSIKHIKMKINPINFKIVLRLKINLNFRKSINLKLKTKVIYMNKNLIKIIILIINN